MPSQRLQISSALAAALAAAPALAGAVVRDNPSDPSALAQGERIVFLEDLADRLIDQPGGAPRRTFRFHLGVISRSPAGARAQADADYLAAVAALMAQRPALTQWRVKTLREQDVSFRVEGLDVGGALVLGVFEADYHRTDA